MLNSKTLPSVRRQAPEGQRLGLETPSVATPSLMLMTIGGKQPGYRPTKPLEDILRRSERRTHGRLALRSWLEPHGELDVLISATAGAIVDLLNAVFDAQRAGADPADRLEHVARQGIDGKPQADLAAVADHPDVVAVEDVLALGAASHERLQEAIDGLGNAFGLGLARLCRRKARPSSPTGPRGGESRWDSFC